MNLQYDIITYIPALSTIDTECSICKLIYKKYIILEEIDESGVFGNTYYICEMCLSMMKEKFNN